MLNIAIVGNSVNSVQHLAHMMASNEYNIPSQSYISSGSGLDEIAVESYKGVSLFVKTEVKQNLSVDNPDNAKLLNADAMIVCINSDAYKKESAPQEVFDCYVKPFIANKPVFIVMTTELSEKNQYKSENHSKWVAVLRKNCKFLYCHLENPGSQNVSKADERISVNQLASDVIDAAAEAKGIEVLKIHNSPANTITSSFLKMLNFVPEVAAIGATAALLGGAVLFAPVVLTIAAPALLIRAFVKNIIASAMEWNSAKTTGASKVPAQVRLFTSIAGIAVAVAGLLLAVGVIAAAPFVMPALLIAAVSTVGLLGMYQAFFWQGDRPQASSGSVPPHSNISNVVLPESPLVINQSNDTQSKVVGDSLRVGQNNT